MLGKRILSAAILIPVVLLAVYLGGYVLWALVLLAALVAGYEYIALANYQRSIASLVFMYAILLLYLLDGPPLGLELASLGVPLITLIALACEIRHHNAQNSLLNWAYTIAGGVYLGFPLSALLHLRAGEQGLLWILLSLLGTWVCDSAAYFAGSRWGKHKFFPAISPKKTWEGAWAGFIAGIAVVVPAAILVMRLPWYWSLAAAFLIVVGATFGDLAESVIKRQLNAKDSGTLIPGHGGMLDRTDSLLFVFPFIYLLTILIAFIG